MEHTGPKCGGLYGRLKKMMRRAVILALAVSLLGMGPGSLSACALFTSQAAECATPENQSQCDQMGMQEEAPVVVATADTSCCFVTQAPVPQMQQGAPDYTQAARIAQLERTEDSPRMQELRQTPSLQTPSPPSFQSLLCTFLI